MLELNHLRSQFVFCTQNREDKVAIKRFIDLLENLNNSSGLFKAYYAVSKAYQAALTINPLKKIKNLQIFNSKIQEAYNELEGNLFEITFLRYLIQSNIPLALGFSGNVQNDEVFLKKEVLVWDPIDVNQDFKNYVANYLNNK